MARITMEVIQHYNVIQSFLSSVSEKEDPDFTADFTAEREEGPWFHAVTSADGLFLRFEKESFGISFLETEITGTPGEMLTYRYYPGGVLAISGIGPHPGDVLILKEGQSFVSDRTDAYGFSLVYETKLLQAEEREHGARIHLDYSILAAGQVLERNEVILEVNE